MSNQLTSNSSKTKFVQSFIESLDQSDPPLVSIYLDTPGGGKDWRQHHKRMLGKLEFLEKDEATVSRYGRPVVTELFERARASVEDSSLWAGDYRSASLLAARSMDKFLTFEDPVTELEIVGDEFNLKRLAPALFSQFDGLVLHFALKSPKLYRVTGNRVKRLESSRFPDSIFAMSEAEVVNEGRRAHSRESSSGNGPVIVPHGAAGNDSVVERNMPGFVRDTVKVLRDLDGSKGLPLIVVAKEKIAAKFEEAYSHDAGTTFVDTAAQSPLEDAEILEICAKWQKRQYRQTVQENLDTLRGMDKESPLYSDNLRELYEGSSRGRVDLCAVSLDSEIWCRYDEAASKLDSVSVSERKADREAFEVTDHIFKSVLRTGGECIVVPESTMPGDKPVVGRLKW